MDLVVVGLNHRSSSVALRERLAVDLPAAVTLTRTLRDAGTILEGMMISTCNRVEVYGLTRQGDETLGHVSETLAAWHGIPASEIYPALYCLHGIDAVTHLFSMTASLDSMVVGEPQILGQVKQAFSAAQEGGLSGAAFNRLMERAFYVAKRVRSETQISRLAVSVSSVAVDLAKKIFQRLDKHSAMLVGAGEMAELAARHFDTAGLKQMIVLNRTYERAVALAGQFNAVAAPFEQMSRQLGQVDIAVFSLGITQYAIRAPELKAIMRDRARRPLFLIDIAVPRNIDPACQEIDNVFLYDIDDLEQIADSNRSLRSGEADAARAIVTEESERYLAWTHAQQVFPVIASLTSRADSIRKAEVARTVADLDASPELAEKIERMTSALVRKLLHHPIQALKDAQVVDDFQVVETVRRVFALEEDAGEGEDSNPAKSNGERKKA